ncbi:MAG: permease-like cell division protein FtsX [Candidatus Uhrbacteria bacterium]
MFSSLLNLLKLALRDFTRNIWLSVTTVIIFTLTLVSVQVLIAVNIAGNVAIRELESRVDVRVQFKPNVSETDADAVRLRFQQRPEVAAIEHHSRADVLAEFREAHGDDTDVLAALEELGENPFGPELRIQLRSTSDFAVIREALQAPDIAELVADTSAADRGRLIEQIRIVSSRLRFAGIIFSALLLVVTLLIIMNAMRIATYARRDEVGIMKLVGAANSFVRLPFLVVGIMATALATILAWAITLPAIHALEPTVVALLGARGVDVTRFFIYHGWVIAAAEFIGLSAVTVVVSALALRRYLRV